MFRLIFASNFIVQRAEIIQTRRVNSLLFLLSFYLRSLGKRNGVKFDYLQIASAHSVRRVEILLQRLSND